MGGLPLVKNLERFRSTAVKSTYDLHELSLCLSCAVG
jgi:hypothetical protein